MDASDACIIHSGEVRGTVANPAAIIERDLRIVINHKATNSKNVIVSQLWAVAKSILKQDFRDGNGREFSGGKWTKNVPETLGKNSRFKNDDEQPKLISQDCKHIRWE